MGKESQFFRAATANALILALPIILAFGLAIGFSMAQYADPGSPYFYLGMVLMVVGWGLLLRSKWSQIKKGEFWTFGISQSHANMRLYYWLGYFVMIAGWLICTFSGRL